MGNAMDKQDETRLKAMAAELAKNVKSEKDLGALTQQLLKLTVETALGAEMEEHLGYEKHDPAGRGSGSGSKGDSYDNVLAETINGLDKAGLIHRRGPWKNHGIRRAGHAGMAVLAQLASG